MKNVGKGFIHHVYLIAVVLVLIISLSACNESGNVELTGDFRCDNLFK